MWYDYGNYQYPNYPSDSVGTHNSSTAAVTQLQYQPHYQQWENNYSQNASDVSCAPGTENMSVTTISTLNCAVPGISSGYQCYPASGSQPPPPGTTSWRPSSSSSEIHSVQLQQASSAIVDNHDGSWKVGTPGLQTNNLCQMPTSYQQPSDSNLISHETFENQQRTLYPQTANPQYPSAHQAPNPQYSSAHQAPNPQYPSANQASNLQFTTARQAPNLQFPTSHQPPNLQFPIAHQVSQTFQSPSQTGPTLDTRRVSKLQIPTNPRIASTLAFGMPKTEKDTSAPDVASKPAYISVSIPKSNKVSHDAAETTPMTGMFPKSFCAYVARALARCKDDADKVTCQNVLKEMTSKARADGTLFTRNWDIEPLFFIPNTSVDSLNKDNQQSTVIGSSQPKYKKSPSRRGKSRWEPIAEEKLAEKIASVSQHPVKDASWDRLRERGKIALSGKQDVKDCDFSDIKFFPSQQQALPSKNAQKQVKKQRLNNGTNAVENGDASSESDREQGLGAYNSGAIALANSPEERKRRENRSKRFDKGHGHRREIKYFRPKGGIGAGNFHRRTSSPLLNKNYEDGYSRAVEDMDWDSLTVKGTCQEIEKRYLRLTSAPDPTTVRPEEVLEKALLMVQNSQKNYFYKCDQLKSIRQDLTVQRIRNELTVKVYETHARLALEAGDVPEYNQCQSQLKSLYAEGNEGCYMEFSAYNLLCVILHSNNNRDLVASMARLSAEAKKDDAVKHALAVRAAVTSGNYILFFRLYKTAPNLNTCLMDLYVEKMRFEAVRCMSRSYRPTVPVAFVAQVLGFTSNATMEVSEEKDTDGLEECDEWLRAHGASIIVDSNGEKQLDTKVSSSSLYMPEPDDAVAHGDTSLAGESQMALLQFEGKIRLELSNCHQICNTSQDGKLPRGKFKVKRKTRAFLNCVRCGCVCDPNTQLRAVDITDHCSCLLVLVGGIWTTSEI
ncbi:hypothetical protein MRB53_020536 [Persea americana]|uniref:Uncharacterized protein n=1 Tax=Persea americana TaxID=3435 RepID=A0ACC2L199_PERAE|nr:hypothetical protein MRB53_020536 [Persea americana]